MSSESDNEVVYIQIPSAILSTTDTTPFEHAVILMNVLGIFVLGGGLAGMIFFFQSFL